MTLAVLFGVLWIALAIAPLHRSDWVLENVLLLAGVAGIVATSRVFPAIPRLVHDAVRVLLPAYDRGSLHLRRVPYDSAVQKLARVFHRRAVRLGTQQLRSASFTSATGLLLAYPIREVFLRIASVRGFWGYFLPLDLTMSTSMLYELIEWGAAVHFGGDLGAAFLGSQGDVWDAQKDMALASLGALITMSVTACVNIAYQRDFAREWADSFRIRSNEPLGEVAIARMRSEATTP